jgi:3-keto-disaccharide hydrolase
MRCILGLSVAVLLLAAGTARVEEKVEAKDAFLDSKLSDWEGLIKDYWTYKDGELVGASDKKIPFNTFLCSKKKYKDFEMTFKVRLKDGAGNSGVQVRSKIIDAKKFAVGGPQCDIGAGYWGSLYGEAFGGMMKAAPKDSQKAIKQKDFNDYSIKVVGKKVTIKVNGETTVDEEFAKLPEEGIIAFQLHAGGPMEVTFKDVKFKELKSEK